ncbi:hypothetical protein IEO21_10789 [Rhodonia placenta]|uniref:Uncharacterized protein n=1 Tax=Rhodonia placenta TaxID=104341 RepID=A0A8H7NRV6_9APHY|nr:hypothetical protein IEO21_10789 [Postia placenta]
MLQNLAHDPFVLLFIGGEDNNEIMEDDIHHCLESRGGIGEAEEHYQRFVQPPVSYKGSLPLITGFDLDIIVSSSDIELCEERSTLELVDHLGNQQQWIAIFDGNCVQLAVVLHRSKCPFLLFDDEEGRNG